MAHQAGNAPSTTPPEALRLGGSRPRRRRARGGSIIAVVLAMVLTASCTAPGGSGEGGDNKLTVAITGTPPSLDPHSNSSFITQEVAWHMYEGLWTIDSSFQAQPMLAKSSSYDSATKTFTIDLRDGVVFHDGSKLDSSDVVASLERWQSMASYGAMFSDLVTDIKATSNNRVQLTLAKDSPVIEQLLAFPNQQAAIMPSEVIEKAGAKPIEEPVGTGPYKLDDYVPDQRITMVAFDDYSPRSEPADGMAGAREPRVDTLEMVPTPEVSVRRDAVITGQVDIAEGLSPDMYDAVEAEPTVEPAVVKPYWWPMAVFDKTEPPFDDVQARQAFMAALDMEPIMRAAFGSKQFYRLQPGVLYPEQEAWGSDAGADVYDQQDLQKAKALLQASGYGGEPLTWLTTREYDYMYTIATVAKQQLEAVGFNIELEVVDYATIVDRRTRPEGYDIFSGATTFTADPGIWPCWDETWPGQWSDPQKDKLVAQLNTTMDPQARQAAWEELQTYFYEQVPMVKFGDYFQLSASNTSVNGAEGTPFPAYWNVAPSDG